MQEFDPWGTVRSGASSATLRNYTGQYLDGTGLLFYNARYYDPVLARFVSPDPIGINLNNPQTRNRFAYVLNNPLKYTDPTGFCSETTTTEAEVAENTRCGQLASELEGYGYQLGNLYDWQSYELDWVLGGTKRLIEVAGWTIDVFKAAMGIANGGRIELVRERANGNLGGYAEPAWFHFRGTARITLYDLAFTSETNSMRTIVHELAHVWDFAQSGRLAGDLQRTTGGTGTTGMFPYRPGGTPASRYARTSRWEDWADSVAAVVIPEHEEFRAPGTTISYWEQSGDYQRRDFVVQRFSDYRGLGR